MTYQSVTTDCLQIFEAKFAQYGTSFLEYTPEKMGAKIAAKAWAAQSLMEGDLECRDAFTSIYNYSVIAYMLSFKDALGKNWIDNYKDTQQIFEAIYLSKDRQYHSEWKNMSIGFLLSEISTKLRRNENSNIDKVNMRDNLIDIANYAVFCEIHFSNPKKVEIEVESEYDFVETVEEWNIERDLHLQGFDRKREAGFVLEELLEILGMNQVFDTKAEFREYVMQQIDLWEKTAEAKGIQVPISEQLDGFCDIPVFCVGALTKITQENLAFGSVKHSLKRVTDANKQKGRVLDKDGKIIKDSNFTKPNHDKSDQHNAK